jgi:hypothetical protein
MLFVLAWLAPAHAQSSTQVVFLGPRTKAVLRIVEKRLGRPDLLSLPESALSEQNPAIATDATLPGFAPAETVSDEAGASLRQALTGQIRVQPEPSWVPRLEALLPPSGELYIAIPHERAKRTKVWKYLPDTQELLFVNV